MPHPRKKQLEELLHQLRTEGYNPITFQDVCNKLEAIITTYDDPSDPPPDNGGIGGDGGNHPGGPPGKP